MLMMYVIACGFVSGLVGWGLWKSGKKTQAPIAALIVTGLFWGAYEMFLENIFAKRYGGTLTITIPEGNKFTGITWKDEDLWYGWYDPKTSECTFREESRYGMLEGKVLIKNCSPIGE
mgnify:CR=1 FL=1